MSEESQEMIMIAKLVKTLTEHLKIISKQSQSIKQLQEMVEAQGAGQLIMFNLLLKGEEERQLYFSQEIAKIINNMDFSSHSYLRELLQEYLKIAQKQLVKSIEDVIDPEEEARPPWFQGVIRGNKRFDEGQD
ncbi:MAG: hypothetical protein V2J55_01060 [Candidatus Competibacteraceae bacterium]|jgi:hypothetical protein|nr:hypothetical protein [Candidatus Competibacteraceae bacterium]